jgi:hypothetical protein
MRGTACASVRLPCIAKSLSRLRSGDGDAARISGIGCVGGSTRGAGIHNGATGRNSSGRNGFGSSICGCGGARLSVTGNDCEVRSSRGGGVTFDEEGTADGTLAGTSACAIEIVDNGTSTLAPAAATRSCAVAVVCGAREGWACDAAACKLRSSIGAGFRLASPKSCENTPTAVRQSSLAAGAASRRAAGDDLSTAGARASCDETCGPVWVA